ncbi:MAG: metallophosphoesterase [Acidobacteria bacterium]|nr:metallophosphoesterase [Acidobacteriota bacterium]MBI3422286.1 metallophosphoesterase [Acidobacteriota bacterium]
MRQKIQIYVAVLLFLLCYTSASRSQNAPPPLTFAVIGDSGDGSKEQYEIARQMAAAREKTPFDFVLMLGDNIYGNGRPKYFKPRFETPYKALLDANVKFYAALGNHDAASVEDHLKYPHFNMDGKRYYNFVKGTADNDSLVEFFVLDTTAETGLKTEQLAWLEAALKASKAKWKVAFMHHSLFSSGRMHPPYLTMRNQLHPLFDKYNVKLVLAGHVHAYERIKPQNGVQYITEGCSGKIMRNTLNKQSNFTAFGQDQQQSFLLASVTDSELKIEAYGLDGKQFDTVTLKR